MAELFSIRLEADLSEFTSTVTDGGDLSQDAAAALSGTAGGQKNVVDDTNAIYGQKDLLAPEKRFRVRYYIDPNSMTIVGGNTEFTMVKVLNAGSSDIVRLWLGFAAGSFYVGIQIASDAFAWSSSSDYNITDAEHYIEFDTFFAANPGDNDGYAVLYIDDVLKETVGGIDNDTHSASYLRIGAIAGIDAGTNGTFYIDEIVANDDGSEIGPYIGVNSYYYHNQQ